MTKPPEILNKMADLVLAYRPPSKVKPPRKRKIAASRKVKENKQNGSQVRNSPFKALF